MLAAANITSEETTEVDKSSASKTNGTQSKSDEESDQPGFTYEPITAQPTEKLSELLQFRSVNPLYGLYLLQQFEVADELERLQLLESVLEISPSVQRELRFPLPEELPEGPLAKERMNPTLLMMGLASPTTLSGKISEEHPWENKAPMPIAQKVHLLFRHDFSRS